MRIHESIYKHRTDYLRWHLLNLIETKNDWRRRKVYRQQLRWMVDRIRDELRG